MIEDVAQSLFHIFAVSLLYEKYFWKSVIPLNIPLLIALFALMFAALLSQN